jgi:DNA invertase Pin-like site-specific DNA recombinase
MPGARGRPWYWGWLVLAEWDRCTRSMIDGVAIIERINARGALVKVLDKPHLDLTTPLGKGLPGFPKRHGGGRAAAYRQAG